MINNRKRIIIISALGAAAVAAAGTFHRQKNLLYM